MIPLEVMVDDVLPKRMTERLLAEQHELGRDIPVVSENANGAESSNPRGVLEFCGDQPTRHWVCDRRSQSRALLQTIRYVQLAALMVQKLSRSSSAAVGDFRYDACDEHICLATNLPGLAPGRLAEPGAAEDSRVSAGGGTVF